MRGRLLASIGGLTSAMLLTTVAVVGQTPRPSKPSKSVYTPPRTPWGDPDLQGLWPGTAMMGVPQERPRQLGERAIITDEEFAQREAQARRQEEAEREEFVNPRVANAAGGGTGGPGHWIEHGRPQRQSSLVVDPPDGRIPPMTAEGQRRIAAVSPTLYYDNNGSLPMNGPEESPLMTPRWAPAVLTAAIAAVAPGAAQSDKADVVARATAYVVQFVDRFSSVVAEERYVQERPSPRGRRELRSDFLLVKPPGSKEWFQFRDVLEVDGKAVGNRHERLTQLFLDSPADAVARAGEVTRENARFNLEPIGTLNAPLIAISFLQPEYAPRFRFTVGPLDKSEGPGVRLVQFREWVRPTILRTDQANGDLPARGRVWIEEATGRVVKTELAFGSGIEITTSYRFDDDLQVIVPVEMRESYRFRNAQMTGVATYGRFRRFVVSTDERVNSPKPPQ